MNKRLVHSILLMVSVNSLVFASDTKTIMQEAKQMGGKQNKTLLAQMSSTNLKEYFDHYDPKPPETSYYQGIEKSSVGPLLNDAYQNPSLQEAKKSIHERPRYDVSMKDTSMAHAGAILHEMDEQLKSTKKQYPDCELKSSCEVRYEKKYCDAYSKHELKSCRKKLVIDVQKQSMKEDHSFSVRIKEAAPRTKQHSVTFTLNGAIVKASSKTLHVQINNPVLQALDCKKLLGGAFQVTQNRYGSVLRSIEYPNCANNMTTTVTFSGALLDATTQITLGVDTSTLQFKEHWESDCEQIVKPHCLLKAKRCDENHATHVINGVPVTRACWQESYAYQCAESTSTNNCASLKQAGCEQIDSICADPSANANCAHYKHTYQCPLNRCESSGNLVCGNGQAYCLNGECDAIDYEKSKDFGTAVSAFGAASQAAKEFDRTQIRLFSGTPRACTERPLGFSNCCDFKGWGHDINLAHCSDEEKVLQEQYRKKLVLYVGRYCSDRKLGVCVEHSKRFCAFPSKLAKIIHEQGAQKQLGKSFGKPKHARCHGLTPEEMQKIDLAKIDFTEFMQDVQHKMKPIDLQLMQQSIRKQVSDMQEGHPV